MAFFERRFSVRKYCVGYDEVVRAEKRAFTDKYLRIYFLFFFHYQMTFFFIFSFYYFSIAGIFSLNSKLYQKKYRFSSPTSSL